MKLAAASVAAVPSVGPAIVTLFGHNVPVLAMLLSAVGLGLARFIAPPPLRKLSTIQHGALTFLLLIILFLIVTGSFTGTPLEPGMAVVWGVGLGFSGLVIVELCAEKVQAMIKVFFGGENE